MSVSVTSESISKVYDGHPALADVSIHVATGELMALLGPSGSGKTTLLRIIAGLHRPDSGRILFDGEDTSQWSIQARNIGFVFQHYALFRHMTVLENIAFGLRARPRRLRPSEAAIRGRVDQLLELVQLPGLAGRFPSQLSGGQRQRVALARALAIEPRVLLLDEPFGALDAKVRKELRRWLREVHDRTGHTTLFVTHDQEEALELADRVAILNEGRVEQVGTLDEIHDRPASPFVHRFVGDTLELPVVLGEGEAWFEGRPVYSFTGRRGSGPTTLFVRSEDLRLSEPGRRTMTAIVKSLRRSGSGRRAEVELGGAHITAGVAVLPGRSVSVGDILHFAVCHATMFVDNVYQLNPAERATEMVPSRILKAF